MNVKNNKLVCVNTSKQITFIPQETVTDNWLVSVLWFRQQDHLQIRNVLLSCSLMLYEEMMNDDGQDVAEHHIEKKLNLLNRVKLSWSIAVNYRQCWSVSSNSWTCQLCFGILKALPHTHRQKPNCWSCKLAWHTWTRQAGCLASGRLINFNVTALELVHVSEPAGVGRPF